MKYEDNTLRHEKKYYIDYNTYYVLRERIGKVMKMDENMPDKNGYLISSIYFDDRSHSAVTDKVSGTRFRKKFRIRTYGLNDGLIRLECKSKFDEYISKTSARLNKEEYEQILRGEFDFLLHRPEKVCQELYFYNKINSLKPIVVVEYRREVYVLPLGNVRITFDKDISVSGGTLNIFAKDYCTTKVLPEGVMVLEVKYDDYIPIYILQLLQNITAEHCAISKYVMCRERKRFKSAR